MRAADAVPVVLELPLQVPGLHAREPRRLHAFVAASVRAVTGGAIAVVEGLTFGGRRQGGDAQQADQRKANHAGAFRKRRSRSFMAQCAESSALSIQAERMLTWSPIK